MKRILTFAVAVLTLAVSASAKSASKVPAAAEPIKILAIGNSFSVDAVEQNLHQIAAADGVTMLIYDMYIGGCQIQRHVDNIHTDKADYRLTVIREDGSKEVTKGYTLARVIGEQDWDFVSVQQASHDSGLPETYAQLPELVEWIHDNAPGAEVVFHQTWTYSPASTHWAFPRYDCDQWKMYGAICNTVLGECRKVGISTLIPSGTAIQNARRLFGDPDLTRDGYHLSTGVGRYIAACTWYEALSGRSVLGNKYIPDGSEKGTAAISAEQAAVCQRAAHEAVLQFLSEERAAARLQPSPETLESRSRFAGDRFGIFIHWGVYSMLGNGEWVMQNQNINFREYSKLAGGFCPSRFDAAQWARAFKASGARYVTFTSRHHDGFSMFDSDASHYNVCDATPFGRDVIGELAKACGDEGLSLHFYYSHLDWGRCDYWPRGRSGIGTGRPDGNPGDWEKYLDFVNAQLTELLTKYGPVGAIWFDGVWDMDKYTREEQPRVWKLYSQYELIHRLQPSCLVGNNHHMNMFPGEDIQIFERDVPGCNEAGYSGNQEISTLPLETCQTMNHTWGYNINDKDYKSVDELLAYLIRIAGKGANLLLNIGPRPDGTLPDEALAVLEGMGRWLGEYGESIYDTEAGIIKEQPWGVTTKKGNVLYLHVLKNPGSISIPLGKKANKLLGAELVGDAGSAGNAATLSYVQDKKEAVVTVPDTGLLDTVVKLTFAKGL